MEKTWKKIQGFSLYEASNHGEIRSLNYKRSGRVQILKPALSKDGYMNEMLLSDSGKYKSSKVHYFITLAFFGIRKAGYEVNHKDGNKTNNDISNLEYVTRRENMNHSLANGLQKTFVHGSKHGQSKLNEQQVSEIREYVKTKGRYYGRKMLADKYGISEAQIKEIISRRRNLWRFV